jgi:hypothetical protein
MLRKLASSDCDGIHAVRSFELSARDRFNRWTQFALLSIRALRADKCALTRKGQPSRKDDDPSPRPEPPFECLGKGSCRHRKWPNLGNAEPASRPASHWSTRHRPPQPGPLVRSKEAVHAPNTPGLLSISIRSYGETVLAIERSPSRLHRRCSAITSRSCAVQPSREMNSVCACATDYCSTVRTQSPSGICSCTSRTLTGTVICTT